MQDIALLVGEDLDLDMARAVQGLFKNQRIRPERVGGFRPRGRQRLAELRRIGNAPHAAPAAARCRLDHHRKADALRFLQQYAVGLVRAVIARNARHAGCDHQLLGGRLVAHLSDRSSRRADEHQPGLDAGLGERGVLRQEPVARMHRVGTGTCRGRDQGIDVEIALRRRRRADADGLVGRAHVRRSRVDVAEHRDRPIAERVARAGDPAGDLAAVGDQDLGERHIIRPASPTTACAFR